MQKQIQITVDGITRYILPCMDDEVEWYLYEIRRTINALKNHLTKQAREQEEE